jgi:pimeloyl-ACP methyl ester carboxylesterase
MPFVEGAGVALHVEEAGEGPPALVVHGMASDAQACAGLVAALAAGGLRAIAYDRRGYGASGAPEPYTATTVDEQAEDALAVLRGLGAQPALVVGEGFGALVALALLVRRPSALTGAVLADPPLLAFVPEATEALAQERAALEAALRDGGPRAAVAAWLAGRAAPDALQRAQDDHAGFFADYGGLASWSPSRRELRGVAAPLALVTSPGAPEEVRAAADAAAALVPGARRRTDGDLPGAALELAGGPRRAAS